MSDAARLCSVDTEVLNIDAEGCVADVAVVKCAWGRCQGNHSSSISCLSFSSREAGERLGLLGKGVSQRARAEVSFFSTSGNSTTPPPLSLPRAWYVAACARDEMRREERRREHKGQQKKAKGINKRGV
jgi:hypothetical protein